MNNQNAIIPGSISAIARQNNVSLAESFMQAEVILIVDTSGSMETRDSRNGQSRYDVACEELEAVQKSNPGKIAVVSFASDVVFCPAGLAQNLGTGTDMAKALRFVKVADVPGMKFILISDGSPDSEGEALAVARTFQNHIDVIYVGPESSPFGRDFLYRLAKSTGGKSTTMDCAKELGAGVMALLGAGACRS